MRVGNYRLMFRAYEEAADFDDTALREAARSFAAEPAAKPPTSMPDAVGPNFGAEQDYGKSDYNAAGPNVGTPAA
jgi:hypothetical protein